MANKDWKTLMREVSESFRKWHVTQWSVTPEKNPTPRTKYYSPDERLVTVKFWRDFKWISLGCSSESYGRDNLQLLALAIESMRLNDVRKVTKLVVGAYGIMYPPPAQPPPPAKIDERDPYAVLGVEPNYPLAVIETIWKARLRVAHPDAGGNEDQSKRLNAAMEEIRRRKA